MGEAGDGVEAVQQGANTAPGADSIKLMNAMTAYKAAKTEEVSQLQQQLKAANETVASLQEQIVSLQAQVPAVQQAAEASVEGSGQSVEVAEASEVGAAMGTVDSFLKAFQV